MTHINPIAPALLTLFTLLAGPPSLGAADPLWQKAVELAARSKEAGLVPGKLEMESTVKKPDGTSEERGTLVFRIVYGEGDESRTEIVSATENGKDVTAEAKAEEAKSEEERAREKGKKPKGGGGASISLEPGYHPFSPKVQGRIAFERVGEAMLEGRKAIVFRFRHSPEKGKGGEALEGRAWLDPDSGAPIQVEVSPSPLPKHVTAMRSTVRFEMTPEGLWRPTITNISGEGGMLWIRRVFESTFRFSDWAPRKAPSP